MGDLATLGTTPIPGDSPTGVSARMEPEFEKLQAEIDKLTSVDPNSINWNTVVELATQILSTRSKDVAAAVYLTGGLLHTQSYGGLGIGLKICADLLKTFWETLWPEKKRLRGRVAPFNWLAERCDKVLPEFRTPQESDRAALEGAVKSVQEMNAFLGDKLEGIEAPNFQLLERLIQDKVYAIPAPQAASTSSSTPTTTSTPSAPAQANVDNPDAARAALPQIWETIYKASVVLRGANPADPIPYVLLRIAIWGDLLEIPPGIAPGDGKTLEDRLAKKEFPGVLKDAEDQILQAPLWLDLHFYVYRAMEGLGYAYDGARKVVGDAVASLARRLPAALNGASPASKLWIQNELFGSATAVEDPRTKARALAARKQFVEAVALLQREALAATSRRDRFVWKLELAKICAEGGKTALAIPILEGLDLEAQKFQLDEWEPQLAGEVVQFLYECHRTSTGDPASADKAKKLYARLSSLDVRAALALDGKS